MKITPHTTTRFQERVRPGLTWRQARVELERLLPFVTEIEQPGWLVMDEAETIDAFVELSDGIVLICERRPDGGLIAVSCFTRASLGPGAREYRNRARARRRARVHRRADKQAERGGVRAMEKGKRTERKRRRWAA